MMDALDDTVSVAIDVTGKLFTLLENEIRPHFDNDAITQSLTALVVVGLATRVLQDTTRAMFDDDLAEATLALADEIVKVTG